VLLLFHIQQTPYYQKSIKKGKIIFLINSAGGDGGTVQRLINIAKEMGFVKLCLTGLLARCVMIGTLTAGQFGIFGNFFLF
jgi:hypothetical protein